MAQSAIVVRTDQRIGLRITRIRESLAAYSAAIAPSHRYLVVDQWYQLRIGLREHAFDALAKIVRGVVEWRDYTNTAGCSWIC